MFFFMRHPAELIKTMPPRTAVRQCILKPIVFDETPRGAYNNYALENSGAQIYIYIYIYRNVLFTNETPHWAYTNNALENSGA